MSVYEYTKLADLSSSSSASKINCYGIVSSIEKEIKLFNPKTKQDQWQLIVQLVDESCSEKQSITCSLYADKQSTVPCVKRIGDILRLHRVPRTAEGFLGGRIGTCGFHAVVWDSEHGGSLNPRGATSANYSSNKDEQQRLNELRLWWLQQNGSMRQAKERLSSLSPYQYGDVICQVIGVIVTCRESTFVRVWDGTRISFPVFSLPENDVLVDQSIIDENLNRAAVGFSQDIICYGDLAAEARCLTPGEIVCVTNLHAYKKPSSTAAQLTMHSRNTNHPRCFKTLSADDAQAQLLLRDLDAIACKSMPSNDGASSAFIETDGSSKYAEFGVGEDCPSRDHDGAMASTSTAVDASAEEWCNGEIQPVQSTHEDSQENEGYEDEDDDVIYSQAPFAVLRRTECCALSAIEEVEDSPLVYSQSPQRRADTADDTKLRPILQMADDATIARKRKSDAEELFPNPLAEKEPRLEEKSANDDDDSDSVDCPPSYHRRLTFDQLIVNLRDWKDGEFISIVDEFRLNDSVWDALFPSRAHGNSDHLFYVECDRCRCCWRLAESYLQPGQYCQICRKDDASSSSTLRLTVELLFIRTIGKQNAVFLCREPIIKELIPSYSSAEALYSAFSSHDDQLLITRFWKEVETLCKLRFNVSSAQVITVCSMRQFLVHKINVAA